MIRTWSFRIVLRGAECAQQREQQRREEAHDWACCPTAAVPSSASAHGAALL